MMAICFEGLGRKFLPSVPSIAFYFLKDIVLLAGLAFHGLRPDVVATAKSLYRGFLPVAGLAIIWTFADILTLITLRLFSGSSASALTGCGGLRRSSSPALSAT